MSDHNPLDIIGRHFQVEFMNPNPRMTPLSSGDRYTLTVETDKELFDMFCEAGREGRAGMILEGMMMVSERHNPVGYENESVPAIEEEEPAKEKIDHTNSRLAAMYCKNEVFREWLSPGLTETLTREEILKACSIKSRAELDTNMVARGKFIRYFCKPYTAYMREK